MTLSPSARGSHDERFPGQESPLARTDPKLVASFDAFAVDEVLAESELDARTRLMTQLAAMIACRAEPEYRVFLEAALSAGGTPVEIKRVVYQAVPYVGMATALDALHATNEVLAAHGVDLPLPGQSTTTPQTRGERGLASRARSSGRRRSRRCTRAHPWTRCTSSGS